jgi:hypothetical protein
MDRHNVTKEIAPWGKKVHKSKATDFYSKLILGGSGQRFRRKYSNREFKEEETFSNFNWFPLV